MKFKIRDYELEIIEVDETNNEFYDSDKNQLKLYGNFKEDKQTINLFTNLSFERKRETLMHELAHAYMNIYYPTFFLKNSKIDDEFVCYFLATWSEEIIEITDRYFKEKKNGEDRAKQE